MRRIHVFRAGTHAPMTGGTLAFSEADLASAARAYDPARHEAPIVVGHPKLDAPAYGWVESLAAEGGDLFATPRQVEPAFAELVEAGRFKKVSAAFYTPTAPSNPAPGSYYLKHVGFLGAAPPSIKGLKPIEFAADEAGVFTVEFGDVSGWRMGWLVSDIATLFRGLRDKLVASDGVDAADKLLPGATLQRLAEEGARLQAEPVAEAAPAFSDTPPKPKDTSVTEQELAERERKLAAREAEFAEQAVARRRADDKAFVDGLVTAAQLPAGLAPRAIAFFAAIDGAEGEVTFGEGDKTVKATPRDALRGLLSALPKVVAFGEHAGGPGPGAGETSQTVEFSGHRVDADRMALHRKALAYQKAHPGTAYMAAVHAVDQAS